LAYLAIDTLTFFSKQFLRSSNSLCQCLPLFVVRVYVCYSSVVHCYCSIFFSQCILPVLLYGCETWIITKTTSRLLDAFDIWCLRKHPINTVYQAHYKRDSS